MEAVLLGGLLVGEGFQADEPYQEDFVWVLVLGKDRLFLDLVLGEDLLFLDPVLEGE